MEKYFLDPNTLLGKVLLSNSSHEVVHLSLKSGNEVPTYTKDAYILLFIIEGEVELNIEGNKSIILKNELVRLDKNTTHSMQVLKDSQILVVKIFN